jgi:hypothetical protein
MAACSGSDDSHAGRSTGPAALDSASSARLTAHPPPGSRRSRWTWELLSRGTCGRPPRPWPRGRPNSLLSVQTQSASDDSRHRARPRGSLRRRRDSASSARNRRILHLALVRAVELVCTSQRDDLRGGDIPVHDDATPRAAVDTLFEGLARGSATDGALLAALMGAHASVRRPEALERGRPVDGMPVDASLFLDFGLKAAHEMRPGPDRGSRG